jgi:hypothetical protein
MHLNAFGHEKLIPHHQECGRTSNLTLRGPLRVWPRTRKRTEQGGRQRLHKVSRECRGRVARRWETCDAARPHVPSFAAAHLAAVRLGENGTH